MSDNNGGVVPAYTKDVKLSNMDTLYIFTGKMCSKIRVGDIEYIERDMRKITIYTFDNKYEVYETLERVESYLGSKNYFKPLKGIILNFDRIKIVDEEKVSFESGRTIMFGRNTICKTRNAFRKYIKETIPYSMNHEKLLVAEKRK